MKNTIRLRLAYVQTMFLVVAVLGLASCASLGTFNNPEQKFEIAYQEILITATNMAKQNRLSDSQMKKLDSLFEDVEVARSAVATAKKLNNVSDYDSNLSTALSIITAIQFVLTEAEGK